VMRYLFTYWTDFNETWLNYTSCKWSLLKRSTSWWDQWTYDDGGIHFDGVVSRL